MKQVKGLIKRNLRRKGRLGVTEIGEKTVFVMSAEKT